MTYINNTHRIIPVQQIAKTRKSNDDAGSQLADAYVQQEIIGKMKRKKTLVEDKAIASNIYGMNGMERLSYASRYIDYKA